MTDSAAVGRNPYQHERMGCCTSFGLIKSVRCLFKTAALLSFITAVALAVILLLGLSEVLPTSTVVFCAEAALVGVMLLLTFVAYQLGKAIQPAYKREACVHKEIERKAAGFDNTLNAYLNASAAYNANPNQEHAEALMRTGNAYIQAQGEANRVRMREGEQPINTDVLADELRSLAKRFAIDI